MKPRVEYVNHRLLSKIGAEQKPQSYLEVGTYEGDSLRALLDTCTPERIVVCDKWDGYRQVMNRDHIVALLDGLNVEYLDGDSHKLLPEFAKVNDRAFDLILVDGDHTAKGAWDDLKDCWPMVKVGGVLLFDDLLHRFEPHMQDTFDRFVATLGDAAGASKYYDLERADGWLDGCGVIERLK